MEAIEKLRETALSVFPIAAMMVVLGLVTGGVSGSLLVWFCVGSALVVLGLSIFLLGVDLGISRLGERCGAALTERRNLKIMIAVAFAIGIIVTAAEPDIQVFAAQVVRNHSSLGKLAVTGAISLGVGCFLALGVARTVLGLSLKLTFLGFYVAALVLMVVSTGDAASISFDSGGATTGPLTVPFIMALGIGVAAVRGGKDAGFGLTGLASVGPLVAMLLLMQFCGGNGLAAGEMQDVGNPAVADSTIGEVGLSCRVWASAARDVATSLLPLLVLAIILQITLLKMTWRQFSRVMIGLVEAGVGLLFFLTGVECGFIEVAENLGCVLGGKMAQSCIWLPIVLTVAAMMGGAVVCAEPAVWALGDQVEKVSGGMIRRKALLVFLAAATAVATALAAARAFFGFGIIWLLLPGYLLALALMKFTPGVFSGMAFDSGGVASGPLTTTLILSFISGIARGSGAAGDGFGVIALVAMMPLLAIQAMGIAIEAKRKHSRMA